MLAKRPNFSDVEDEEHRFKYNCATCSQEVIQPFLKGLWYHVYNFTDDPYGCQNLIHKKFKSFDGWSCYHDFRFTPDMLLALKCIKCNFPLRFDLIDIHNYFCDGFFCYTCNKEFKTISIHSKKHKGNGFEFKLLSQPNKPNEMHK